MLKLYGYGYLNRVQSSRRLLVEAQRNIELMWLTGRLAPEFKTIADFRKDKPVEIRLVCREFVMLCKKLSLLSEKLVAIDGSKSMAVNSREQPAGPRLQHEASDQPGRNMKTPGGHRSIGSFASKKDRLGYRRPNRKFDNIDCYQCVSAELSHSLGKKRSSVSAVDSENTSGRQTPQRASCLFPSARQRLSRRKPDPVLDLPRRR